MTELGGHKSLYSEAFYDRETFDRLYDGANLAAVKQRYDPDNRLTVLYEKAVKTTMTDLYRCRPSMQMLEDTAAAPLHGVRRQRDRPRRRAVHVPLHNERGLAYLVTAPGDLGLGTRLRHGRPDLTAPTPATPTRRSRCSRTGLSSGGRARRGRDPAPRAGGLRTSSRRPRRRRRRCRAGAG